jgi:hypothetical protein
MSRTLRGLAAGAAAVLAFTGVSLAASAPANADQDECLQILDHGSGNDSDDNGSGDSPSSGTGNGTGNGTDNGTGGEDDNGYEAACDSGDDFESCLTQLMFGSGVSPIMATQACEAAHDDEDSDESGQGGSSGQS